METQRKIDGGLSLFIAMQWFLMGDFLLGEPGNGGLTLGRLSQPVRCRPELLR